MGPFCFVIHPLSFADVVRYERGFWNVLGKPLKAS